MQSRPQHCGRVAGLQTASDSGSGSGSGSAADISAPRSLPENWDDSAGARRLTCG
jgi:hypothetical protein